MGDEHGRDVHNLVFSADEDVVVSVPDVIGSCAMGVAQSSGREGGAIGLAFEQ